MRMSESISKLSAALLKAQSSMGDAKKGATNPYFKSNYADLNSIREAVLPAMNAVGISVLQPTVTHEGKNYVETVLLHESGEYMSSLTEIISAKLNDPQANGSGISYARRYGLQSIANVGAMDDDGEAAMGRNSRPSLKVEAAPAPGPVVQKDESASVPSESAAPKKMPFNKPGKATTTPSSNGSWS